MRETVLREVELARDGRVTSRTYVHLGYERWTRGVYGVARPTEDAARARFWSLVRGVAAAYAGRPVVLYGPTALQVLGVALPGTLEDWERCHVLAPATLRLRRVHVVTHDCREMPRPWRLPGGLPVLHPVDHWLQLPGATDDELVEVGDGLMRRQSPLLTHAQVVSRLGDLGGVHGVRQARRVLPRLVAGTDSLYETRTRCLLVRAGLPCPAVNLPVFAATRGRWYHVDMGYEAERVAVEYDGAGHVGDRRQMEIDARRRRDLQDAGWLVITVTADQLRHPREVIASIEQALYLRRAAGRLRAELS